MEARVLLIAGIAGLCLAVPTLAYAAPDDATNACLTASEDAQGLRDKGRLLDARAKLIACGRGACPAVVRTDCAKWLDEINARIPSIVVRVVDESGRDAVEARIFVDDGTTANAADGRAIDLDPGPHKIRAEWKDHAPVEQTVVAHEGERMRAVQLAFGASKPATTSNTTTPTKPATEEHPKFDEPAPKPPVPTISWILGGVAIAGGISFGVFASRAKSDVDDMRTRCAPGCPDSEVSSAKTELTVANVSLVVGVLALGTAIALVRW